VFLLYIIGEGCDELVNEKTIAPELESQLCYLNRLEENIPRVACFHSINDPIFGFLVSHVGTPCWKGHTNSLPDMLVHDAGAKNNLEK